jgi:hypothetical protein
MQDDIINSNMHSGSDGGGGVVVVETKARLSFLKFLFLQKSLLLLFFFPVLSTSSSSNRTWKRSKLPSGKEKSTLNSSENACFFLFLSFPKVGINDRPMTIARFLSTLQETVSFYINKNKRKK